MPAVQFETNIDAIEHLTEIKKLEQSIEQLFEKFRLAVREIYNENKNHLLHLDETKMSTYNQLVRNIPESDSSGCTSRNHHARSETLDNKICIEWSNLKLEIDMEIKQILEEPFDNTQECVCCLKDLPSTDIYGSWNGTAWVCHFEKDPGSLEPPLTIEEIRKKIEKPSSSKEY